jgi:hypothetical protein
MGKSHWPVPYELRAKGQSSDGSIEAKLRRKPKLRHKSKTQTLDTNLEESRFVSKVLVVTASY